MSRFLHFQMLAFSVVVIAGCNTVKEEIKKIPQDVGGKVREQIIDKTTEVVKELPFPEPGTRGYIELDGMAKRIICGNSAEALISYIDSQRARDSYGMNAAGVSDISPGTAAIYLRHDEQDLFQVRITSGLSEGQAVWIHKSAFHSLRTESERAMKIIGRWEGTIGDNKAVLSITKCEQNQFQGNITVMKGIEVYEIALKGSLFGNNGLRFKETRLLWWPGMFWKPVTETGQAPEWVLSEYEGKVRSDGKTMSGRLGSQEESFTWAFNR